MAVEITYTSAYASLTLLSQTTALFETNYANILIANIMYISPNAALVGLQNNLFTSELEQAINIMPLFAYGMDKLGRISDPTIAPAFLLSNAETVNKTL